ncbi:lachesin isoform X2 [Dermacentor andersoni]|uniref:lachesin isoform X2 n=1 Tax=Dermacentor andersoni TaxID=34620 RepID=UPI002155C1AE|nr:lachesin-like isoform X2 [Dermacentor andersoni]
MAQVILFLAALVSLGSCQQSPVISYISKEMVVGIGDTVDLQCSVQYAEAYPIIWIKINERDPSNNLFISSGSKAIVPDQRFSIRHDEGSNTYTLQITKLQETDSGLYQCQIILGPTSKLSSNVYVHVRVPPIISDNSTRSVIASTGQNITLECYATGNPTPHISWRRENNDLLPTGGAVYRGNILNIFNVSKNDRGTYYCIADNGVGNGARRNIGVEVEFAPVVSVDRPRYGQALQNPMDLLCHIEAFPSPSIVWLKDGYQLNDNQYYQISIFSTADEFTDSTLRIIAIEKKQYGNYTCKALNKLGNDEKIIELYETVNVICPPACDKSYQSGSSHLQSSFACFLVMLSMICAITLNKKH